MDFETLRPQDFRPEQYEAPSARPTNNVTKIVAIVMGTLLVVVIGVIIWLLLPDGENKEQAAPAPAETTSSQAAKPPTAAPVPSVDDGPGGPGAPGAPGQSAPPSTQPTAPTVAPSAAPQPSKPAARPAQPSQPEQPPARQPDKPTQPRKPAGGKLDKQTAIAGLEHYFQTAPGNPEAGWGLLSSSRQSGENRASYNEWWSKVRSAKVAGCSFDDGSSTVTCKLTTVLADGTTGVTQRAKFKLVVEGGQVKIDGDAKKTPDEGPAAKELERIRNHSIAGLQRDGHWAAVLSAKKSGTKDPHQLAANGTNTFYLADILAVHESMTLRFSEQDMRLIRGKDMGNKDGALWITVYDPGSFSSAEDVTSWCEWAFPELSGKSLENQCLPRQVK